MARHPALSERCWWGPSSWAPRASPRPWSWGRSGSARGPGTRVEFAFYGNFSWFTTENKKAFHLSITNNQYACRAACLCNLIISRVGLQLRIAFSLHFFIPHPCERSCVRGNSLKMFPCVRGTAHRRSARRAGLHGAAPAAARACPPHQQSRIASQALFFRCQQRKT